MTRSTTTCALAAVTAGLLTALVALVGALGPAAPASAHTSLVSANPVDGATVDRPPAQVRLEFSEEVSEPAYVSVTIADGLDVTGGRVAVDGAEVTRRLDAAAAAGEYTIAYRVVSADGHPIEGELSFTAREPAAAPKARTQGEDPARESTDDAGASAPDDEASDLPATEPASASDEGEEGYWQQHGTLTVVAVVLVLAAGALLLVARRRGRAGP